MLEFFNVIIGVFKDFIDLLFRLPFIGNVSYGHMLLAIYFSALVLFLIAGRLK